MQTSVIGFPRIGTLRELKFASEKYFRKEIEAEELQQIAETLRKTHWSIQKEAGIDYISSNDFSFYDMTLDTAVLLNIIPKRYKELELSGLDTYFAMARGYQGASGDVKALAMKKWFNTNYHYIVPEVEDDTVISFSGKKLLSEFEEAKELGIYRGKGTWNRNKAGCHWSLYHVEAVQIYRQKAGIGLCRRYYKCVSESGKEV